MKITKNLQANEVKASAALIEVKNEEGDNGQFVGYASVFNHVDLHNDVILPGAFKESIEKDMVQLLWQHDHSEPIGRINKLAEDNTGLLLDATLLMEITRAREAYSLLKNKIIKGLSIGFRIRESYYNREQKVRYISKVQLYEISLVTFPANQLALIGNVKTRMDSLIERAIKLFDK